jgi:P pilus assembly chaperone PapD
MENKFHLNMAVKLFFRPPNLKGTISRTMSKISSGVWEQNLVEYGKNVRTPLIYLFISQLL